MSLFAGILCRAGGPIPSESATELLAALSRRPEDQRMVLRSGSLLMAKVDVGSYQDPVDPLQGPSSLAVLVGDPLLRSAVDAKALPRRSQLELLNSSCEVEDWSTLGDARGAFALAQYNQTAEELLLVGDKLGLRPIYWWADSRFCVFSTSLRVLRSVAMVPRRLDLRGAVEQDLFGYCLDRRTPYVGLRRIHSGEIVRIGRDGIRIDPYHDWDLVPESGLSLPEHVQKLNRTFREAMSLRLSGDRRALAFLSGGMDSRCIAALLRDEGVSVDTFNFSPIDEPTLDRVLAERFASAVGTRHHSVQVEDRTGPNWSQMMVDAVETSLNEDQRGQIERLGLVWSGDGGSVCAGHVHMSRLIVEQMRSGNEKRAGLAFLEQESVRVVSALFTKRMRRKLEAVPLEGVLESLSRFEHAEPGRRFHLFLLCNDQRRHLDSHFENIDLHRLEFHLPFYDSSVIEVMLGAAIDDCLGHQIYSMWFEVLPDVVGTVPWQTYPGHVSCPLPMPEVGVYQWDNARRARRANRSRSDLLRSGFAALFAPRSTFGFRRRTLAAALCLHALRISDYSYVLRSAANFHRLTSETSGVELSGLGEE